MADPLTGYSRSRGETWDHVVDLDAAKSDSVDLDFVQDGFYIETGGDVKFTTVGGETATITFDDFVRVPYRVTRIWSTGTTASGLWGGY